jgi:hypothetical protein
VNRNSCSTVQAWGGAWPGGVCKCLRIPGLKGSSHGDPVGLRGGSLGCHSPGGKGAGPEDLRSHGLWSSSYAGLWGRAWCVAPAILLVYSGAERPPMI